MGRDCLQAMPCKEEENKRNAVKHLFLIPRKERFFADAQNDKATKGKMTKKTYPFHRRIWNFRRKTLILDSDSYNPGP